MKEKIKNTALAVIPYAVAFVLNLALYGAGLYVALYKSFPHGRVFLGIALGLLGGCMLISTVGKALYRHRFDGMAEDELLQYILSNTKKLREAFDRAEKALLRLKNDVIIYIVFIAILTLAVPFFYGASDFSFESSRIALMFCSMYIQADLIYVLIGVLTAKPDFSEYESEKDFPLLYAVAHRAADAVGVHGDIRFFLTDDCNAGIQRFGKIFSVELGVPLLAVLTEEELYQVFLHEFAHMQDEHIRAKRSAQILSDILEMSGASTHGFANMLLFALPSAVFNFDLAIFEAAVSLLHEEKADAQIEKTGDAFSGSSGLAKIAMYELYLFEKNILYPQPFFENPQTPTDACTKDCMQFRGAIEKRKDFWLILLFQELPPRLSTHPTFGQRWEALGKPQFSVALPEENTLYFKEVLKAAKKTDDTLYALNKDEYAEMRKEEYLDPLATVQAYEQEKKELSAEESRPIIEAYMQLNRFDEMQEICESVISRAKNETEAAHAYFALGGILLLHYDKRGAQYIQKAIAANQNYAQTGFDLLGPFYARMGMKQELQEYRKQVDAFLHHTQEREAISELRAKDNLHPVELTDSRRAQIAYIAALGGEALEKIYLVRKEISDSAYTYAYILRYVDNTDETERDKIETAVFNYLDTEEDQYSLFAYDKGFERIFKAVGNCCVYEK